MRGKTPFSSIVGRIGAAIASARRRVGRGATPAPAASEAKARSRSQGWHITREGDSICRIAKLYGISPYSLMVANPQLMPATGLESGQSLRIPRAAGLGPALR